MSTSSSIGEGEACALLIYDGYPVYHTKKYNIGMGNQEKHDFVCEFMEIQLDSELITHRFADNLEIYYLPQNRNRHFMECLLTDLDYADEYDKCDKVTSPVVMFTTTLDHARKIVKTAVAIHNKIQDIMCDKFNDTK